MVAGKVCEASEGARASWGIAQERLLFENAVLKLFEPQRLRFSKAEGVIEIRAKTFVSFLWSQAPTAGL